MSTPSNRTALIFSCLGHLYVHCFTAFYFVIVLAIERDWRLAYSDLIGLWTVGAALVGAAALPAGWLADRWGASRLMVLYFVGMGACAVLASMAPAPQFLLLGLSGIGLFAAIYHPVGVPWLIRNAPPGARGRILAVNGIFGSLGAAVAGLVAGYLIEVMGWRSAFWVPGVVCVLTGVCLAVATRGARTAARDTQHAAGEQPGHQEMVRVLGILLFTMFCAGIIYHSMQTSLPKLFEQRHGDLIAGNVFGVGVLVAIVYTAAGVMQLAGGFLADRFALKPIYVLGFLFQIPLLLLVAKFAGLPLLVVTVLALMALMGVLPAENMLLAHYSPERRHGLVFGVKFVLAFGTAPIAVQLVSLISQRTDGFFWLYSSLAVLALLVITAAWFLPGRHSTPVAVEA